MITLDALREAGADVDGGMVRCLGKEDFYLKMVNMAVTDGKYGELRKAVEEKRLKEGFEYAHGLKGTLANVGLTGLLEPVLQITEGLRRGEDLDYGPLLDRMDEERAALLALMD